MLYRKCWEGNSYDEPWATRELDDAEHSNEDYDALRYAAAGYEYYTEKGFSTSYDWIPGKGHAIDGMFGGIVGEQLRLNNIRHVR